MTDLTPVERHGDVWLKRDDLYTVAGQPGAKARACAEILQNALHAEGASVHTAVTACGRKSPQAMIVANVAAHMGLRSEVHTPSGEPGAELVAAMDAGAVRVAHRPGHNSVIIARAREAASQPGHVHVPFGMDCEGAVEGTAAQVAELPWGVQRMVVPVGSGINLAGILRGLQRLPAPPPPVLGVVVGADPRGRLDRYCPGWDDGPALFGPPWPQVQLVPAGMPYQEAVRASVGDVRLDPIYEAKCAEHLRPGDLLWIVGIRANV